MKVQIVIYRRKNSHTTEEIGFRIIGEVDDKSKSSIFDSKGNIIPHEDFIYWKDYDSLEWIIIQH